MLNAGIILDLPEEGCIGWQTASRLNIFMTNFVMSEMTINLSDSTSSDMKNLRMTASDLQKECKILSGVKCTAVCKGLLEAGLKSHRARKEPFINENQRRTGLEAFTQKNVAVVP